MGKGQSTLDEYGKIITCRTALDVRRYTVHHVCASATCRRDDAESMTIDMLLVMKQRSRVSIGAGRGVRDITSVPGPLASTARLPPPLTPYAQTRRTHNARWSGSPSRSLGPFSQDVHRARRVANFPPLTRCGEVRVAACFAHDRRRARVVYHRHSLGYVGGEARRAQRRR